MRRSLIAHSKYTTRVYGLTSSYLLVTGYRLKHYVNASQKGKGLRFSIVIVAVVFLAMSMGFDLDCCVPYPVLPPKKFTVFGGSAILYFIPLGSVVL